MFRSFLLCAISCTALLAQPQPTSYVRNAASYESLLAPGSYGSISFPPLGAGIASDATITLTAADSSSVRLTPIVPPAVDAVPNPRELWFVIPPNTRSGPAVVTTVIDGATYNNSIEIVETSPGLFTISYSAFGPALALNHPATRNGLTAAAVPNGIVSLFATGLNGARAAEVTVELDGRSIAPLYAGPQGQPGLDQINFVVPPDPAFGCYVPVAIRVRGVPSNQTTLSINRDPYACAHPLGLSYGDLKTLDAGGNLRLARLTFNSSRNIVEEQPLIENAHLAFPVADATMAAVLSGVQTSVAPSYSCILEALGNSGNVRAGFASRATITDVGNVTLAGPAGQRLELQRLRFYSSEAPSGGSPYFTGGLWSLSAAGGSDIGAFQRAFTLPPQLQFTNLTDGMTVPSQGFTLRWNGSGFGPGDIANIAISSLGSTSYAYCIVPAWKGQVAIADSILESFKGRQTYFHTTVYPTSEARQMFTVPGATGEIHGLVEYYFSQRISANVE